MYKNIMAGILGLNGLLLVAIGVGMITTVSSRITQLGLADSQAQGLSVSLYALGVSDSVLSIFSFAAMVLIYKGIPAGKVLAYVVGANLILAGAGIFILTKALFGLYFIALRGVIIIALTSILMPGDQGDRNLS